MYDTLFDFTNMIITAFHQVCTSFVEWQLKYKSQIDRQAGRLTDALDETNRHTKLHTYWQTIRETDGQAETWKGVIYTI